jgi:hypothetical protein
MAMAGHPAADQPSEAGEEQNRPGEAPWLQENPSCFRQCNQTYFGRRFVPPRLHASMLSALVGRCVGRFVRYPSGDAHPAIPIPCPRSLLTSPSLLQFARRQPQSPKATFQPPSSVRGLREMVLTGDEQRADYRTATGASSFAISRFARFTSPHGSGGAITAGQHMF